MDPASKRILEGLPSENGIPILDSRYEIIAELGRGGMGVVYKARHRGLDRTVAIKVPFPWFLDQDPSFRERFFREARAAARIDHPNVIRVFDVASSQGITYLAMEYVPGVTVLDYVRSRSPLKIDVALRIVRSAAKGLGAAHSAGLVHRDVKPANLLISKRHVKVADLGLAKPLGNATDLTQTGSTMGTPRYMAPEQWADPRKVDARADVYALGATLYFLLVGDDGLRGANVAAILDELRSTGFPHLAPARIDAPRGVVELVAECTASDPARRPVDGNAVVERLDRMAPAGECTSSKVESSKPHPVSNSPHESLAEIGSQTDSARDAANAVPATDAPQLPDSGRAGTSGRPRERWVLCLVTLYVVLLLHPYGSLIWLAAVTDEGRSPHGFMLVWLVMGLLQIALVSPAAAAARGQPVGRKAATFAFAASFLLAGMLALFLAALVEEAVLPRPSSGLRVIPPVVAAWVAWVVAFLRLRRGRHLLAQVLAVSRWIWRGSITFLLLLPGLYVLECARGGFLAGMASRLLSFFAGASLLIALGPSIVVLFADRYLGSLPEAVREGVPASRNRLWLALGGLAAAAQLFVWLS